MCFPLCVTVDVSGQSGSGGGMTFQGLLYAASFDQLSIPLMQHDNMSMVNLSPDLLEEVKNVLIPADMLRIEDSQIIGKGKPFLVSLLSSTYFVAKTLTTTFHLTQATLGQFTMDT